MSSHLKQKLNPKQNVNNFAKKSQEKCTSFEKYRERRFREKEILIFNTCFDTKNEVGVKDFSHKTGIAKSTFYRHHQTIHAVQTDYENFILYEFSRYLKDFKQYHLKETYRRMLCFILIHQRLFKVFPKKQNSDIFRQMVLKLKSKILSNRQMHNLTFQIYVSEVAEILKDWAKRGCQEKEMEKVLRRIMFLTDTARLRLGPLS